MKIIGINSKKAAATVNWLDQELQVQDVCHFESICNMMASCCTVITHWARHKASFPMRELLGKALWDLRQHRTVKKVQD